ncbi:hypothetical protein [Streptomyces adelaidensis]|uniref:hypothetical protein n=1 Tax=Streptomyces adelaidensis TaxID=2796465 RepID=UPI001F424EB6|nr:hypothetical protein [Streptomyces adelaidensis]
MISVVLVVVRLAFLFSSAYLIRLIDRRPQQRLRRISHRARVVSGFAGFRSAVSLAVALSVPETLDSGGPFTDRDFIHRGGRTRWKAPALRSVLPVGPGKPPTPPAPPVTRTVSSAATWRRRTTA